MIKSAAALLLVLAPSFACAHDVVRHKLPNNSTFPIAAAFGSTQVQTVSVLKAIESQLKAIGLTMGDVVKMQVFLVGDPAMDGRMDFKVRPAGRAPGCRGRASA